MSFRALSICAVLMLISGCASSPPVMGGGSPAEEAEGEKSTSAPSSASADDLAAKTQNPIGAMISLPFEGSLDFGAPDGSAFVLNMQPVIPVNIGDWNLINRTIIPLAFVDGFIEGLPEIPEGTEGDGAWGLGDINHTTFLSPAAPGALIWGTGLSLTFPTATDPQLGTEKWSAGPSVVVLGQPKPWSLGILLRQLWSFAGANDRPSVNQLLVQPFVSYNLEDGWYLTSSPVMTANWKANDVWTVPLGGGAGKIFKIGDQAMNARVQAFYNVVHPDGAPDWSVMFTIQFLFPK